MSLTGLPRWWLYQTAFNRGGLGKAGAVKLFSKKCANPLCNKEFRTSIESHCCCCKECFLALRDSQKK